MRKRVQIALAVLLVVIAGIIGWQVLRGREPVYEGKGLTVWLEEYLAADNPFPVTEEKTATMGRAGIAIRHMGTNAVPFLMEMARAKDSVPKRLIEIIARHQSLIRWQLRTDHEKRQMAVFGFYALGSIGNEAIPALVTLLHDQDSDVRLSAADCLGNIGPEAKIAVPLLLPFVNDTNRIVAWDTTVNLGRIHMEPALVVPVLIERLSSSNAMRYRGTTIYALSKFGEHAKSAIPFIVPYLSDGNDDTRSEATNAIKAIDPEAAAKAGVK
jgi:hypothetical protein